MKKQPNPQRTRRHIHISEHAKQKWQKLAHKLGYDPSTSALIETMSRAVPEQPTNRGTQFHIFARSIMRGKTLMLTADGWRFVTSNNHLCTVERTLSHENFH